MTTIKVPRELRDRLAEKAKEQRTTLAGALERALDESDEQLFWARVRADNFTLSAAQRESATSRGEAMGDDLTDPGDDALGAEGW